MLIRGIVIGLAISLTTLGGCDQDRFAPPEFVEVQGEIFLDGQALTQAKVVFIPINASKTSRFSIGYGETDSLGAFRLTRREGKEGIYEGSYRVLISRPAPISHDPLVLSVVRLMLPGSSMDMRSSMQREFQVDAHPLFDLSDDAFTDLDAEGLASVLNQPPETVPAIYNRHSQLTYEVSNGKGVIRPRFDLYSVDPLLNESDERDSSTNRSRVD